mgnify:CR=1 FL=1
MQAEPQDVAEPNDTHLQLRNDTLYQIDRMARDLDEGDQPATKFVAYLGWLEAIETAMPPEADALDLAQ